MFLLSWQQDGQLFHGQLRLVSESFDYGMGEVLNSQSAGTGFGSNWVADSSGTTDFEIQPDLIYPGLGSSGNAMGRGDNTGRSQANRQISTESRTALTTDNTTIWFSVVWQPGAAGTDERGAFLFGNAAFGQGSGDPKTGADGFGFSPFDGVQQSSIRANAWVSGDVSDNPFASEDTGISHSAGGSYLLVGKINWKPSGTPDEFFLFNINDPSALEPSESSAVASITSVDFNQADWDMIALFENHAGHFDEIRLGATFSSVVPTKAVSTWTEWYRPADQPVFTTSYGNNHDCVLFHDPDAEYPYYLIVSHETSHAYLWRTQSYSWDSADWELVSDSYTIDSHYEFDDGVKVGDTYYVYEAGYVYTYTGDLADSDGNWTNAGTFPAAQCDDIGVFYEDGVFHIFGEYGDFPPGPDGTSLSHYTSTTGLGGMDSC